MITSAEQPHSLMKTGSGGTSNKVQKNITCGRWRARHRSI
ncbi:hypothetical protein AG1IA_00792 [Rhizoctonia solani AG-1 IA]|uniref:Uncharacterized protein n=1 Tax=Thanatephorus cucumeris (strain AG1-IA) TaxID=983506 RepID=L8X7W5_THACA|nr:hypothetical protein AG1IA_00792 [Rhizoctonia solani AG-1 IA]